MQTRLIAIPFKNVRDIFGIRSAGDQFKNLGGESFKIVQKEGLTDADFHAL